MRKYRRLAELAKKKARNRELLAAQQSLPLEQFILGVRQDIEAFTHGQQLGYVVFDGRKVPVEGFSEVRPSVRSKMGIERTD